MVRVCGIAFAAALLAAFSPRESAAQRCPDVDRVLWVGDSWSDIQWDQRILGGVFDQFGFGDMHEYNDDPTGGTDPNETAISGMTAAAAADPGQFDYPTRIANVLAAKPEIDVVLISLGGNDIIAGGWLIQGPAFNPAVENPIVVANIDAIVQAALAARPDVEVVIYGYDYVGLWEYILRNISNLLDPLVFQWVVNFGNPPAGDFYDDLLDLEARKKALADGDPRVHYINNLGTMNSIHGHDSANWGIGVSPRPDASNFPAAPFAQIVGQGRVGTDRFGQPPGVQIWRSDTDWIHLSDAAYRELCINGMTQYFVAKFRGAPDYTAVSIGAEDGWSRSDGVPNAAELRIGRQTGGFTYRSILSFDTSGIPAGATVTRASLFVLRDAISGTNPLTSGNQGEPRLDINANFFGSSAALESNDWSAAATATDVGCYAGSAVANDYLVRVDVDPAGLSAVATGPGAKTQFRLYFQNIGAGTSYLRFQDGSAPNLYKPFLDVFYTVPSPTPTITPTRSPSPSPSTSPTATPSRSPSPSPSTSPSASASPSPSPSRSPSPSASPTPSPSPTATPSRSPSPSPSSSPSPSPSASPTAIATASPSPTPSASPTAAPASPSPSPSPSASPTSPASPSPTASPIASPSPSPTASPNAARDWTRYE